MIATLKPTQVRGRKDSGPSSYLPAATYWFASGTATLMRGKSILVDGEIYTLPKDWLQNLLNNAKGPKQRC